MSWDFHRTSATLRFMDDHRRAQARERFFRERDAAWMREVEAGQISADGEWRWYISGIERAARHRDRVLTDYGKRP